MMSEINKGNVLSLPKGWEIKTIGDVCVSASSNVSQNKLANDEGDYPIYGASGFIKKVSFYHQDRPYLSIVKDGSGVGRVTKMDAYTSVIGTLQYILPKENIDLDYLNYSLMSVDFKKYVAGAAIPHIYFKDYKNEPFLWMPLPEQQRIVSILDEAFSAIERCRKNAEQNLKNAKELFESYLQGVFENKGEDWEETSLIKEIKLIVGFAFKSKEYSEQEDDILLVRGDNIMQGYFRWQDAKRWRKYEYEDYEKYQLHENDIVLAMDRPWVKAGLKIARISKLELPALLVQRTACLRTKDKCDNSFLFHLLNSNRFMQYLIDVQTGIGVPHISGQQILEFKFKKPSLQVQQTIVRQLDALRVETQKLEAVYQKKIADLEELKKSILVKAFSGELGMEN
jgi:type I restriction enzyme, S subunit